MKFNSDFKYDLEVGQVEEERLAHLLSGGKIEVKRDFIAHKTGNVFVEYESRGAPSGISTTQADYWAFVLEYETVVIIPSNRLKQKAAQPSRKVARHLGETATPVKVCCCLSRNLQISVH